MKFGVVIVVYHSFERIIKYVQDELPKLGDDCYTVIVDNDAAVEDSRKLAEACKAVLCDASQNITNTNAKLFLINSPENLGYARGNNLGAKFLRQNFNVDYFLFSNDDIVVKTHDILPKLVEKLKNNPNCKIIGPRMIGGDGTDVFPHRKVISIYRQIGWNLFPFLRGHRKVKAEKKKFECEICYWVCGAFMLVEAQAFEICGLFDKNTFLYYEEPILAERFLKYSYSVLWSPDVEVLHEGSCSTPSSKFAQKELLKSSCYYYQKYFGIPLLLIYFYRFCVYWNSLFWKKRQ